VTRRARQPGFRQRWKAILHQLRQAYESGDVRSLRTLWYQGLREPGVGWALRLFNRIYPLQAILDVADELNGRMAEEGLARASRWLLEEKVVHWRAEVPPATQAVLAHRPVVIYGNHPSLLTLFLVSSQVDRPDFRVVAASFLERFLPGFAPYAYAVELPVRDWWRQFWEGGLQRLVVVYWVTRLRPVPPKTRAKELNRMTLRKSIEHVRDGGALLIAPQGWSRTTRRWYPGLGIILQDLAKNSGPNPLYLVAYHEENSTDALVHAFLAGGARSRRVLDRLKRDPVKITFSQPRVLVPAELLEGSPADLVERLRRDYEEMFSCGRGPGYGPLRLKRRVYPCSAATASKPRRSAP